MELFQQFAIPYRVFSHYWRQKMAPKNIKKCPHCGRFMQMNPAGGWQCLSCEDDDAD